jgi:hypothetical protein
MLADWKGFILQTRRFLRGFTQIKNGIINSNQWNKHWRWCKKEQADWCG